MIKKTRPSLSRYITTAILVALVIITLLPFAMTILMSFKTNHEVMFEFWSPPAEFRSEFMQQAAEFVGGSIFNSVFIASSSVVVLSLLSSLSGYVFARMEFPGKETLFVMILSLMMIPGVLTLIPMFLWFKEFPFVGGNDWMGVGGTGFYNTRWMLVLHYIAGGQIIGIFLCRTFIENLPNSLFEAARIDGASELQVYRRVALPLTLPIVASVSILNFVAIYNDYVWPLISTKDKALQTFSLRITNYQAESITERAPEYSAYVIGSIPLILVLAFGMKYYIEGLTKGAVKG